MNKYDIDRIAVETGLHGMAGWTNQLYAFARSIADLQKEKDAQICYELSCASGGGKASTPGGACLECGDAIRSPETDLDEALRRQ